MAETMHTPVAAPGSFKDRTVIVSGACGTLGRGMALGTAGANVVAYDIKAEAVNELVSSMNSEGHTVLGISLSATSGLHIVEETIRRFGSIHVVINATLGPIPWKPFENLTDADFQSLFETTVLGPINLTRAAWPHFKNQKFGRVVNFTSDSILGMPLASTYTLTKDALFGVNKTLATEGAAHNIKVNCVSPIAYKPEIEPHIAHFSEDTKEGFRTLYKPEANVPMILALVSEGCEVSGKVFQTAGWAVGRSVWGTVEGERDMRTVEDCLERVNGLCEKGDREVFEPIDMNEFSEFQAKWVLGKK